jgi:hypothetical protein
MVSPAARAAAIPPGRGDAPWAGHEYVRGWGVFGLPFESGHVLALRVFPEGTFGPNRSVWHRDPQGAWTIAYDAPRADMACPRYFGPAASSQRPATVGVTWLGPRTLRVQVPELRLTWTTSVARSARLAMLNPVMAMMPLATWRSSTLIRARQLVAARLGLGDLSLRGRMPSGHVGLLMPERLYLLGDTKAVLDDVDLGRPAHVTPNPRIGDVALPARGVLAFGQAMWPVLDLDANRHEALQEQP